ncbi:MAG: hypothetical protein AB7O59_22125 [Pirellulales bacterium]
MLGVTMFGIFLTPVFYYVIEWCADMRKAARSLRQRGLPAWVPRLGRMRRVEVAPPPTKRRAAAAPELETEPLDITTTEIYVDPHRNQTRL